MARAVIGLLFSDPADPATQVCTDVGHDYIFLSIISQYINREFFLRSYPTCLGLNGGLEQGWDADLDLTDGAPLDPGGGFLLQGGAQDESNCRDSISQTHRAADTDDGCFHKIGLLALP